MNTSNTNLLFPTTLNEKNGSLKKIKLPLFYTFNRARGRRSFCFGIARSEIIIDCSADGAPKIILLEV